MKDLTESQKKELEKIRALKDEDGTMQQFLYRMIGDMPPEMKERLESQAAVFADIGRHIGEAFATANKDPKTRAEMIAGLKRVISNSKSNNTEDKENG